MRIDYDKGGLLSPQLIRLRRKESQADSGPKKKVMLVFPTFSPPS